MITIGDNIRKLREERGWHQDDLTKLVGCSGKYISKLERGQVEPGPKMIHLLCDAFMITEQELRFGESDQHGLDRRHGAVFRLIFDELSLLSETEQLEELVRLRKRRETVKLIES
jgi:transcriptional regulator with XRE-family HTH domain